MENIAQFFFFKSKLLYNFSLPLVNKIQKITNRFESCNSYGIKLYDNIHNNYYRDKFADRQEKMQSRNEMIQERKESYRLWEGLCWKSELWGSELSLSSERYVMVSA